MTNNPNITHWIACFVVAATLVLPGCSTGLFKPVQPWYTVDSYQQTTPPANAATLSNPMPKITPAAQTPAPITTQPLQQQINTSPILTAIPKETAPKIQPTTTTTTPPTTLIPAATEIPPAKDSAYRYDPQNVGNLASPIATSSSTTSEFRPPIIQPNKLERSSSDNPTINANWNTATSDLPGATNIRSIEVTPKEQNQTQPTQRPKLYIPGYETSSNQTDNPYTNTVYRFQSPQNATGTSTFGAGGLNEFNPLVQPNAPTGQFNFPQNYADLDIYLSETSTGRINFGGAYNSDTGLVGQFVIDERNFDLFRLPRNFREIVDGTAFRGGGQNFRLELVPGSDVERYLINFSEPFLGGTRVSLSTSLYYFQRQFFDFDTERLGGRFAFGYRLTPDLSVSTGIRLENVEVSDPRNNSSAQLNAVLGDTDLYIANVGLVHDTRDHPFLPTQGTFTSVTFSQAFGEFDYPRGDLDFRTYRLMYQRPDGSGRHTLSYGTRLGFSGAQTPVFENYYAGGFSTLRGFDFRGASPLEGDIRVGGEFQWLNSIEYTFPLTADDMVKGVLFTDFGTVEQDIELNSENFRVAPGFGFRVHMPAAGIGAPLAFDFAFPVSDAAGDERETFSFYLGLNR